jgi:hypothetical protein
MATTLYFVQSDTLPQIKLTLTDEISQSPKNLTNKLVSLHAKPSTGTGVSFTRPCQLDINALDRQNGIAYVVWEPGDLNRPAGNYLAEIEIYDTNTSSRETIYETLTLVIREDIADITPLPPAAGNTPAPNASPGGGG